MRLLVLGSSSRAIANWLPGIDALARRGAELMFLGFTRLYDPDAAALPDFLKNRPARIVPLYDENKNALLKPEQTYTIMREVCRDFAPDIVLLTTCHIDPEASFLQAVHEFHPRPVVIGLQHGFYQAWQNYTDFGPCVDYFFCFGELFFRHFPAPMQLMLRAAGLPKLDLIQPAPGAGEDIVYLAQGNYAPDVLRPLLRDICSSTGLNVRVRPHPELRRHYEVLTDEFPFDPPELSLPASMAMAKRALAETTTAVLEFLCLGRPVAVLPNPNDFDFRHLGLVAEQSDAAAVIAVWDRWHNDENLKTRLSQACSHIFTRDAAPHFADTVAQLLPRRVAA